MLRDTIAVVCFFIFSPRINCEWIMSRQALWTYNCCGSHAGTSAMAQWKTPPLSVVCRYFMSETQERGVDYIPRKQLPNRQTGGGGRRMNGWVRHHSLRAFFFFLFLSFRDRYVQQRPQPRLTIDWCWLEIVWRFLCKCMRYAMQPNLYREWRYVLG